MKEILFRYRWFCFDDLEGVPIGQEAVGYISYICLLLCSICWKLWCLFVSNLQMPNKVYYPNLYKPLVCTKKWSCVLLWYDFSTSYHGGCNSLGRCPRRTSGLTVQKHPISKNLDSNQRMTLRKLHWAKVVAAGINTSNPFHHLSCKHILEHQDSSKPHLLPSQSKIRRAPGGHLNRISPADSPTRDISKHTQVCIKRNIQWILYGC